MRSFLDLFRANRDGRTKAKTTKLIPEAEGLESRNLLARISIAANTSGVFADPFGTDAPITGVGTNTVDYGTPVAGSPSPSRLSFAGQTFPTPIRIRHHRENSGVQIGQLTFVNTRISSPSLTAINLLVTISSDIGQRVVRVPLQVTNTPNVEFDGPDTVRLIGKPIIRLIRGFSLQIVGFALPDAAGGRPTLSRELTVDEDSSNTVTLVGKLIRR